MKKQLKRTNKTKWILLIITCLMVANVWSAPIVHERVALKNPDDSIVVAYISGDEFFVRSYREDGYTMIRDPYTGFMCWAELNNIGDLVSTGYDVVKYDPGALGLVPNITISQEKYLEIRQGIEGFLPDIPYRPLQSGTFHNIVIFVRFADQPEFASHHEEHAHHGFGFMTPREYYEHILNGLGDDVYSLRQFYRTASYGQLDVISHLFPRPVGNNIVSYQDFLTRDEYKDNASNTMDALLKRAINFVKNQIEADLTPEQIDKDGNGIIDNIAFIIRGDSLYSNYKFRSRKIQIYNIDIHGKTETTCNYNLDHSQPNDEDEYSLRRVGTICHEFGHSIGFPDLYAELPQDPIGIWCLMARGIIDNPSQISTYTKARWSNWLGSNPVWYENIPEITIDGRYSLSPIETSPLIHGYRFRSTKPNEFFIAEYRTKSIDTVPYATREGSGLVFFRINLTAQRPAYVYRVVENLLEEDVRLATKAFFSAHPDASDRIAINDFTHPAPVLTDGSPSGFHITNIGYPDDTISFYFTTTTHEYDLVAHKVTGPLHSPINVPIEFNIEVINIGINDVRDYTVQLLQGNNVIASETSTPLLSAHSRVHTFSWTPTTENNFTITGHVILAEDQRPNNNTTKPLILSTEVNPDRLFVEPGHCIQAAINMLSANGSLILRNGVHESPCLICNQDTVYLDGKNIKIQGYFNFDEQVIVKQKFVISNVTSDTSIEKITFEPVADDNYSIAVKLINSTPILNNLTFNLNSDYDIVGIHADYSSFNADVVLEITDSVFKGNQGIYFNGHDTYLSQLILSRNEFTNNFSTFGHYGEGSAISFRGTHLDVLYSKFNIKEIDIMYTNPIQIVLKNNNRNKAINLFNNEFITNRYSQPEYQNNLLFTPATQQTIFVSGNNRYNFTAERNIFKRINHLSGDTTTNNVIVLGVSPLSPNFETRLINNSEISLRSQSNNSLVYLNNPDSYSFISHGGKLIARNNLLTGEITTTSGSAVNDVQGLWDIGEHGNPNIDLISMTPLWTSSIKSPLIDSGYVLDNLSWFGNAQYTDSDGTRVDIGAVPATHHGSFKHSLTRYYPSPNGFRPTYNWVSFPYLDKLYEGQQTTIRHLLHEHNNNNLLIENPVTTNIEWNIDGVIEKLTYDPIVGWSNDDHIIESRYGYKMTVAHQTFTNPDGISITTTGDYSIITSGFLCGNNGNHSTASGLPNRKTITVYPPEAGNAFREHWVGYFKANPEKPLIALKEILPWLVEIKSRNWTYSRPALGTTWEIPAGDPYINQGEMVSIRYAGNIVRTFEWQHDTTNPPPPEFYIHPETVYFDYEEQADYIPFYVYIPEDMAGEGTGEIGLIINGEAYGAEVIQDDLWVQINAYILDIEFDDPEIEFQYVQYGTRSAPKRIDTYAVLDQESNTFKKNEIDLNDKQSFYIVSFNMDEIDSNELDLPIITALGGNYPNPFNPVTTISYDIAKDGDVVINIFNIRGQRVKTLVDEYHQIGRYVVDWNGTDDNGRNVSSGVYFYQMKTGTYTSTRRMVMLK